VSVSEFEIQCDFPACSRTLRHGAVRPPLTVTEFRQGVGMLLRAHRWITDAMGHNLCPYHSQRDDDTRILRDRRQWQRQLMRTRWPATYPVGSTTPSAYSDTRGWGGTSERDGTWPERFCPSPSPWTPNTAQTAQGFGHLKCRFGLPFPMPRSRPGLVGELRVWSQYIGTAAGQLPGSISAT
jgi:hypothetical protein